MQSFKWQFALRTQCNQFLCFFNFQVFWIEKCKLTNCRWYLSCNNLYRPQLYLYHGIKNKKTSQNYSWCSKMFVSPETGVRCLQTPTASLTCGSGQSHTFPCVHSLLLNDFEFRHSPAPGGAGGLRRTANLGGGGILQRMNGNGQVYMGFVSISVS